MFAGTLDPPLGSNRLKILEVTSIPLSISAVFAIH